MHKVGRRKRKKGGQAGGTSSSAPLRLFLRGRKKKQACERGIDHHIERANSEQGKVFCSPP